MNYTEKLLASGRQRTRLTEQLQTLVCEAADAIAATVPTGEEAYVAEQAYSIIEAASNIGSEVYLAAGDRGDVRVFANRALGSEFYLHGDFSAKLRVVSRDDLLHLANHLPELVAAFEANEQQVINALRNGLARLREMVREDGK